MNVKLVRDSKDIELQSELFAYLVATHYKISLQEAYDMDIDVFKKSLSWAMAMNERDKKNIEKQSLKQRTGGEVVDLDYSWLAGDN
tara:strand:+ start:2215 stop:2472 length:258 start_codon:yes stop_codon:yes gene_type:complete